MTNQKIDTIGTFIILTVAFLLPIFFLPFLSVPLQETKLFLLTAGVFLAVLLWTIARLKGNSIAIPQEKFVIPLITLPFIALFASLFSGDIFHSLVGQGFQIDTVFMILILVLGFGSGVYLFNSKNKVIKLYLALTVSFFVLFLYQTSRLMFGEDFLSFNLFTDMVSNPLGKWNDVAIFAGLITILSFTTLDILRPKGSLKILFYAGLVSSLIMLVIVNFPLVWVTVGFFAFILFVRSFLEKKFFTRLEENEEDIQKEETASSHRDNVSSFAMLVLILAVLFVFIGPSVDRFTSNQFGLFQVEVRPSWQSTMAITEKVYSDNIFFGVGPNNFTKEWLLNKPAGVNNTLFWNTDFSFGVAIIPTFFVTHGILSVIAWITFLMLFLWAGVRALVRLDVRAFDSYLLTSSFFLASFLWIIAIFYVPHITLFFFAFLLTGIFLATQIQAGLVQQKNFQFNKNLRAGFIGIILLFALLAVSIVGSYVSFQKFVSVVYVGKANVAANLNGDIEAAEGYINRALTFEKNDAIYRAFADVAIFKLNTVINQGGDTAEVRQQFQLVVTQAIERSRLAIVAGNTNYRNWVTLGQVYEILIPVGVEAAYENARVSYEQALVFNPQNPGIVLRLARIEVLNGNNTAARERIAEALTMKNDYTNAIFLLSQIEISEGNVGQAIASIEAATFLEPQNQLAFFQLGILKYSENDYSGAAVALERAVLLNNQYANARYFLGLSYYQLDRVTDAIKQFIIVRNLNADNTEVNTIIENLKDGRAPFENFVPVVNPLKGRELPVEE